MKKHLALLLAIAVLFSSFAMTLSVSAAATDTVNVTDYSSYVENAGTESENWTPAINKAIEDAVANGKSTVYLPAGTYQCEPDSDKKQAWEGNDNAAIYLPDAAITIKGDGSTTKLTKGPGAKNITAMFRTAYKGTAAITISDLAIVGKGNPGSGEGLIEGIVINGSSNGTFSNITILATKRHAIYLICGAEYNTIENVKLSDMNRECLGTGLQFEGASNNTVKNIVITNVGANGIDLTDWNTGSLYPSSAEDSSSPYDADYHPTSCNNVIIGGRIGGTGIQSGSTTSGHDDDYYGINIIRGSNDNEITLDYVGNIRPEGINTNAAAIRLMEVTGNVITVEKFRSSINAAVKIDGETTTGNTVNMKDTADYRNSVLSDVENARETNTIILTPTTEDHVLKATVKFTEGAEGVAKYTSATVFGYNPFGDFKFEYGDKIYYEYLLGEATVAGMGTVDFQGNDNWATMESCGGANYDSNGMLYSQSADMTKLAGFQYGKWTSCTVEPNAGITNDGNSYSQGMAHFALTVKTTAAVDTTKAYTAYYRNIKVIGEDGTTRLVIYDGKRSLNVSGFAGDQNATMAVEEAVDPTKYDKVLGVTYEALADGDVMAEPALYSLDLAHAPACLFDYEKDYLGNVKRAVIKPGYSLSYEYAFDTADAKLGEIKVQESTHWWGPANNADLKNECDVWTEGRLNFSGALTNTETRGIHNISLCIDAKGAKAGDKYNVYFRNMRIVDGYGNIVYKVFDPTVTTTDDKLSPENWGTPTNCVWSMSIVNDPYKPVVNVSSDILKATVNFSEGTAGTVKEAATSVYGWNGDALSGFTFAAGDKISYEYLVEDSSANISGLGTIDFQSNAYYNLLSAYNTNHTYGSAYSTASDLTGIIGFKNGYWVREVIDMPNDLAETNGMGHFLLGVKTTDAVDVDKDYVVYYRNIIVIGADGKTRHVIFDGSQNLNTSNFVSNNASMTVTKAAYSTAKDNVLVPKSGEDVIDIGITFTNTAAGEEKFGEVAVITDIGNWAGKTLNSTDVISYDIMLDSPVAGLGGIAV